MLFRQMIVEYQQIAPDIDRRRTMLPNDPTTVDNRGYLLVFNNHLPKQHFKL